jgi:DNA-binding CsgD family transcriptional regulator
MTDPLDLIGSVYDAGFDAALWPRVMTRVGDAVSAAQVLLRIHDFSAQSTGVVAPRMDPDHVRSYCDHWGRGDLLWQRVSGAPVGKVLFHEHLINRDELFRTEFYNEWMRPIGIGAAGLGVNLLVERGVPAAFGVKSKHASVLTDDDVALFALLAPHLVRAAQIHRCLRQFDIIEALAGAGLETLHKGVFLVDSEARVAFANEIAAAMFDTSNGLQLSAAALSTVDPDASAELRRLIAGCADPRVADGGPGGSVNVRRTNRSPLRILVAPFRAANWRDRATWLGFFRPTAILVVSDPEREKQERRTNLRYEFGLTPAEADVALEISKGDGRAAAAARLAISLSTLRVHLQRVFEKTGVHRQAELVRLLTEARRERPIH